jgi:hypothetical protein
MQISTSRDIQIFRYRESFLTIAADTLGAIGLKPGDAFQASPQLCGQITARVCLMETLAVGSQPFALTALTCNERIPTGMNFLEGIRKELAAAGFPDIPIGGSTEDNMPTPMTALGITLLGECENLSWRLAQPGDGVYLLGKPYVGEEVLAHLAELPSTLPIMQLRNLPAVGDIIPCGSRGIAWELHVLEEETGLHTKQAIGIDSSLLKKSAGPATCAIVTSREPLERFDASLMRLGSLIRL